MKSKSAIVLMLAVGLCLTNSPAMAWIQLSDGGAWNIDYEINDDVWVDYGAPGVRTTVKVVDGGHIPVGYKLKSFEDSVVAVSGGKVARLDAYGRSQVDVAGGLVPTLHGYETSQVTISGGTSNDVSAYDSSRVTVLGGVIGNNLIVYDNSRVSISGGSITRALGANNSSQVDISGGWATKLAVDGTSHATVSEGVIGELTAGDSAQLEICGGWVGYVTTSGRCTVTISGGTMPSNFRLEYKSEVDISGGLLTGNFMLSDYAVLTLHGLDFAVDGTPAGYTQLLSLLGDDYKEEPQRRLTGTLLSGEPIDSQFRIGNSARIALVPEPATLLLLGLGSLVFLRRCRA